MLKYLSFLLLFQISFLFAQDDKPVFSEITYLKFDSTRWEASEDKFVKCDFKDPRWGPYCQTIYLKIYPNKFQSSYPLVDIFSVGMIGGV